MKPNPKSPSLTRLFPENQWMLWTWAGWEPEAFYHRLGGFHEAQQASAEWLADWRKQLDSAEAAELLKQAGVTHVTTRFYKGFGLEAERPEFSRVARMIEHYHRHGLKVFTYIQYGSIMPEAITLEKPDATTWKRLDWKGSHDGHPYEYGDQYWRDKPCANQPGFLDSLKSVIAEAIAIGTDGIWLDNLQSDGCHCPLCQQAFQNFLRKRITNPFLQLGLPSLDRIEIPRGNRSRDPLVQWWYRFRREETEHSLTELVAATRRVNPELPFIVNIGLGSPQLYEVDNGNWPPFLKIAGITYAENGLFPNWEDTTGTLLTQHFPFKLAEASGFSAIPGSMMKPFSGPASKPSIPTPTQWYRMLGESLLFGDQAFGGPFGLRAEDGGDDPILLKDAEVRQFWQDSMKAMLPLRNSLQGSSDAATTAILYSYEANAFDAVAHRPIRESIEQLLHQHQLPFRYLLSTDEQWPEDIKLLIIPHILPMDDSLITRINSFVQKGGKLVITGRSGFFDEHFQARKTPAFESLFPSAHGSSWQVLGDKSWLIDPHSGSVWVPGKCTTNENADPETALPKERLADMLSFLVQESQGFRIQSPAPHVLATVRLLTDGSLGLGLINYSDHPVSDIRITFSFPLESCHFFPFSSTKAEQAALPISANGKSIILDSLPHFTLLKINKVLHQPRSETGFPQTLSSKNNSLPTNHSTSTPVPTASW